MTTITRGQRLLRRVRWWLASPHDLWLPRDPGGTSEWAIGIYVGHSPHRLTTPRNLSNPVLTRKHVTDVPAAFVADPFMIEVDQSWHLFFEVMDGDPHTGKGKVGLAISKNGFGWTYERIVLEEPFHLSYPYVFEWGGHYYMTPECYQTQSIRLYRADPFPYRWRYVTTLVQGGEFVDPSVVHFDNRWWLFASDGVPPRRAERLHLFHADDLLGPWAEHPLSPVMDNPHIARPAGRLVVRNDRIIRYAQDCDPIYGRQVRAFEITELTPTAYRERRCSRTPVLRPTGRGWNSIGMHHVDPHVLPDGTWIASVDGWRRIPRPL